MSGVKLTDIVEKMNLKNLTPEVDVTEREVRVCLSGDFGRREKS